MTVRDMLMVPGGVFDLLQKEVGVKIVLVVPRSLYKKFEEFFAGISLSEQLVIEQIDNFRYGKLSQQVLNFFVKYLVLTDTMKLLAQEGVRTDTPPAGGRTYLYALKQGIFQVFGRSKWLKNVLVPKLFLWVTRERPYRYLFDRHHPDLIFIPDVKPPFGLLFLAECRIRGITSVQMPGNWDHFKYYFPLQSDYLLTTNEPLHEEAIGYENYPIDRVTTVGFPQFDYFVRSDTHISREAFLKNIGFNPGDKIVLFVSEGVYSLDGGDIADMILRGVESGNLPKETRVLLRPYPPYPGTLGEEQKYSKFEKHPLVRFAGLNSWSTLERFRDFIQLLYHADVVVSTYSTVGIEALVFDKPSINIGFDGYHTRLRHQSVTRFTNLSHFQHVTRAGGIKTVTTAEELLALLKSYFANPSYDWATRAKTRDRMCYRLDGKASERIVSNLINHMHRAKS